MSIESPETGPSEISLEMRGVLGDAIDIVREYSGLKGVLGARFETPIIERDGGRATIRCAGELIVGDAGEMRMPVVLELGTNGESHVIKSIKLLQGKGMSPGRLLFYQDVQFAHEVALGSKTISPEKVWDSSSDLVVYAP